MKQRSEFLRVFALPLLMGAVTVAGLSSALLADGVWDAVSWLTLGSLLVVIAFYVVRSSRCDGTG